MCYDFSTDMTHHNNSQYYVLQVTSTVSPEFIKNQ